MFTDENFLYRNQLAVSQNESKEKMQRFVLEEKHIREENLRLHRKLQQEVSEQLSLYMLIDLSNELCL